jgi:hypothetical protein
MMLRENPTHVNKKAHLQESIHTVTRELVSNFWQTFYNIKQNRKKASFLVEFYLNPFLPLHFIPYHKCLSPLILSVQLNVT